MFSQKSQTMSVHFVQFNPYQLSTQNFRKIMVDNLNQIKSDTVNPVNDDEDPVPPVFLKRNLKHYRKKKAHFKNNDQLVHLVPQVGQIVFKNEDSFANRKSELSSVKELFRQDL